MHNPYSTTLLVAAVWLGGRVVCVLMLCLVGSVDVESNLLQGKMSSIIKLMVCRTCMALI